MIPHCRCWCSCYCNMFHESHSKRSSSLSNVEVITALSLISVHHPMLPDGVERLVGWANSLFFLKTFVNFFCRAPTLNRDVVYKLPVIYQDNLSWDPQYKSLGDKKPKSITWWRCCDGIKNLCLKRFLLSCKLNHSLLNLEDVIGYAIEIPLDPTSFGIKRPCHIDTFPFSGQSNTELNLNIEICLHFM